MASRGRVALGGFAAALIATTAGAGLFKAERHISISQTSRHADAWYTNDFSPLLPGLPGCGIAQSVRPIGYGSVTTWTVKDCASAKAGRLFAIGNSHAIAYMPLFRQFALDSGHETRLFFRSGCAFLGLNEPMTSEGDCIEYFKRAEADFLRELRPGDILFMPSMRLGQGTDQWGKETSPFTDPERSATAMVEARDVLSRLAATGALLVFEAPKPLIPSPTYRCVDWYMTWNPICKDGLVIDKTLMLQIRAPVLEKMQELGSKNPRVQIWDPLPVLCPDSPCRAMDGALPIFFDRHHVSAHGNRMLRENFDKTFEAWFDGAAG
jgi:hypothetical protein